MPDETSKGLPWDHPDATPAADIRKFLADAVAYKAGHHDELTMFQARPRLRRQAPRTVEKMVIDVRSLGEPLADAVAAKLEEAIPPGSVVRIDSMSFGPTAGRHVVAESWQGTALPEEKNP